jgi:hypothetical protein
MRYLLVVLLSLFFFTPKVEAANNVHDQLLQYNVTKNQKNRVDELRNFAIPSGILTGRHLYEHISFEPTLKDNPNFDSFTLLSLKERNLVRDSKPIVSSLHSCQCTKIYILHQVFRI